MQEDKISVIVPVFNKGPWLHKCLGSIVTQTYQNLEIVVVNNGSTDSSRDIIELFAKEDPRIIFIDSSEGFGFPNGHNVGVDTVSGEFFTIVDADDYIDTDYIEKLHSAIKSENADVAMCVNDLVWDDGRRWNKARSKKEKIIIEGEKIKRLPCQLLNELSNKYYGEYIPEVGVEWIKLIRTSIVKEHGIRFNPELHIWVDWVFMMQIMLHISKFVFITNTEYHFNQSDGSETRRKGLNPVKLQKILLAMDVMQQTIQDYMTPLLEEALMKFYVGRLHDLTGDILTYWNKDNNAVILQLIKEIRLDQRVRQLLDYDVLKSSEFSKYDEKVIDIWKAENTVELLKKCQFRRRIKKSVSKFVPSMIKKVIKRILYGK